FSLDKNHSRTKSDKNAKFESFVKNYRFFKSQRTIENFQILTEKTNENFIFKS
ncbi:hypothetical protein OLS40_06800, partial [Campylobacter jejuni]|nr:hypothetical protein [Campylobacter jejuni]